MFPKRRAAVFVHGCFWHRHGCSKTYTPKSRHGFWEGQVPRRMSRGTAEFGRRLACADWRDFRRLGVRDRDRPGRWWSGLRCSWVRRACRRLVWGESDAWGPTTAAVDRIPTHGEPPEPGTMNRGRDDSSLRHVLRSGPEAVGARRPLAQSSSAVSMRGRWPLKSSRRTSLQRGLLRLQSRDQDPARIAAELGSVDLLLASPECTSHSCARGSRPRCDASRDTAFQVVRYAEAMGPQWVVVENVVRMRRWHRYAEFVGSLRAAGYRVAEHVLDAADHGVPQKRRRLFLLCDRDADPPSSIPKRPGKKRAARSILDSLGTWSRSPLDNGRRAAATLDRAPARHRRGWRRQAVPDRLLRQRRRGWLAAPHSAAAHRHHG